MSVRCNAKGVSNLVLMLGIIIAMAVLLIGGTAITFRLLDAQASSDPRFVTTSLVSIINTVQAAPETATFNYYTDTDSNGYPIIGSLEIDDSKGKLCVSKKTEDEIYSTVLTKTAIAAGLGGVEYAYERQRSSAAQKAASKIAQAKDLERAFPTLSKAGTNPKLLSKATEKTTQGDLYRKFLLGKELSPAEMKKFVNIEMEDGLSKDVLLAKWNMAPEERDLLEKLNQPSRFEKLTFITKYLRSVSSTIDRKISVYTSRIANWAGARIGYKAVSYVGGGLKAVRVATGGLKGAAFVGGLALLQTQVTGGNLNDFIANAEQISVFAIAPKIISYLLTAKIPDFILKRLPSQTSGNTILERVKEWLARLPPPWGQASCFAVHGGQIAVNFVYSIWNTVTFDNWMLKIYDAAGSAVSSERSQISCQTFSPPSATKTVLLTPPNCMPKVEFGPALEGFKKDVYAGAYLAAGTAFAGATDLAFAEAPLTCETGGIAEAIGANTLTALTIGAIATVGTATGFLADALIKDPTTLIPKTSCDPAPGTSTCDTVYLQQDCPNYFMSYMPGAGDIRNTWAILGLMQGGPACAAVGAASGWGSVTCDAARVSLAASVFFFAPQAVYSVMLRTNEIGFTKTVNQPKSALGLTGEFANNNGYWYAELPYALEITKLYTNDTVLDDRTGNFVIRKV